MDSDGMYMTAKSIVPSAGETYRPTASMCRRTCCRNARFFARRSAGSSAFASAFLRGADLLRETADALALLAEPAGGGRGVVQGGMRGTRLRRELLLGRAQGAPDLGAKLGDGAREQLDLPLGSLLRGVKLSGERLAQRRAAVVGRPTEDQREADQRGGGRQEGEERGRIHGDRLSAPEVVSTSVRPRPSC